jgi:glycosyltransferase involved in cell wall biosynthesis
LLEEAVESFIRQEWDGPKELVVLNDHPEQELQYDHPEVRVFNLKWRLPSLGDKRNLSAALANHEYLLVWDDDDIHLPWRIRETMKVLPAQQYFKCPRVWLMKGTELQGSAYDGDLYFHGACAYTKRLFRQVGGYRRFNGGEDQDFEARLRSDARAGLRYRVTRLPPERLYYIRRWGHGSYHASGRASLSEISPEVERGARRLKPHWKKDYCEEVERLIRQSAPTDDTPGKPRPHAAP